MLGLLLLALRLALGVVVAPLLAARLSRALGTRVEIGDLSFQPLDAIITLRAVTVHAPVALGAPVPATPPIVADRVRIDVQWLPLFHQTLRVRELALESARVDLDRFPDGGFGLANLERADPTSELPAGWSFALDRIAVRDSWLRVRDLAAGGAAFVEANLHAAEVSGIHRRPTAFGKAPNLRVDALVEGGQLRVRGRYELRDDGIVLDAVVRVKDLPLAQVKSYVADLGWTDLSGGVSGQLHWQREPRRRDLLSGRLILRRGRVQVADLTEPALAVRRGIAEIAAIDLLKRRIAIESLTLRGATLALRPDVAAPFPLVVAPLSRPPSRVRRHGIAAQSASRWAWMVKRFDTADGRVRVLAADWQFDVRARATGENLGPGAYWSPLRIEVARHQIAAGFDGTVRLAEGVTIEGHLTVGEFDFPSLAHAAGLPWAELVQAGRATADLTVQFDTTSSDALPLYARGAVRLTDLWISGPDPSAFAFETASVDLTLDGFSLREPGRTGGRGSVRGTRIRFSDVNVGRPSVILTRTTDGWVLPPFTPAPETPPAETPTEKASNEPAVEQAPDETVEIVLGKVRVGGGSVRVVDLVPSPAITWSISLRNGSAQDFSLPALTFGTLQLHGSDPRFGDLRLGASRRANTNNFEVSGEGVPLAATTPYLNLAGLPYQFAAGTGAFTARGSIGNSGWRADAGLKLQAPVLTGADAVLQREIGMPVPEAVALLRDQAGEVTLQVALASAAAGDGDVYTGQIGAGVRDAIRGVREAAAMAAQAVASLPPVNLRFPPGRTELTMAAMAELAPLAEHLHSRPDLVIELAAQTSVEDRRWLAERALQTELEGSGGVRGVLRAFGMSDARDRIRIALAARARGTPGFLDADDEALLERLLAEAPPVRDTQLDALREARLTRVVNHLATAYGITGKRIAVRNVAVEGRAALAAVRARLTISPDRAVDLPAPAAASEIESPLPAP